MSELPHYKCHKVVQAAKITRTQRSNDVAGCWDVFLDYGNDNVEDGSVRVSQQWLDKHNPQPGGYLVVYEDGYGYQLYSPAEVFEAGYSRVDGPEVEGEPGPELVVKPKRSKKVEG